ncbi:MAG: DUF2889 domain-containing protein [Firmicutes bacterium]|nr:DUF2889 domain-containing protein [Bacillota bacterium]
MQIYSRQKSLSVTTQQEDQIRIEARLIDQVHEIGVILVVRVSTEEILEAEAIMQRFPWSICPEVVPKMGGLVGLKIQSGIRQQVKDIIGRSQGCTHLVDLVMEAVQGAFQAIVRVKQQHLTFEEQQKQVKKILKGTCYAFSNLDRNPVPMVPKD